MGESRHTPALAATDKESALQAIIDEMTQERKAICEALGCVDLPGVALKFAGVLRRDLSKAHERHVELIRSWDRASLTERQELDEMRRGWGPSTPTERMRRHADVAAAMQCLSGAMGILTLSEEEAEAADPEVNQRLDEAYERVNKQYIATIGILSRIHDPILRSDMNPDADSWKDLFEAAHGALVIIAETQADHDYARKVADELTDAALLNAEGRNG